VRSSSLYICILLFFLLFSSFLFVFSFLCSLFGVGVNSRIHGWFEANISYEHVCGLIICLFYSVSLFLILSSSFSCGRNRAAEEEGRERLAAMEAESGISLEDDDDDDDVGGDEGGGGGGGAVAASPPKVVAL
jgi:hypothetical protein